MIVNGFWLKEVHLPATRCLSIPALFLVIFLQACASTDQPGSQSTEPELTLNLPQRQDCNCQRRPVVDYTFLEKGLHALAAGDYVEAIQYFQRYERMEDSDDATWEAQVATAFVYTLPHSALHDDDAARKSYRSLREEYHPEKNVHPQILLVREAMEMFLSQERQLRQLRAARAELEQELGRREEALRRLRELALDPRATAQ